MEIKTRFVLVRIDDLANMLKHYMDPEELPRDAAPVNFQTSQADNRKLAITFEHPDWTGESEQLVDVQLKRVYSV
jgi:hypothetical protein